MISTNVPQIAFTDRGFVAPAEDAVLAGVQADMNEAFGGNLNLDLTEPQGQLAQSLTAMIGNANAAYVFTTQQVDPAYASGRMQDAIGRIYFIERRPATATVVQCLCTGGVGVTIPVGALAKASDGNLYSCTQAGEIGVSGNVTLPFACQTFGPIACPEGSLNRIYQAIPSWDSINNLADGVVGNNTQTRTQFEEVRAESVAVNAVGSVPAVRGSVLLVDGVLDAYVYSNNTASPVTITNFTIAANSLYVAVVGGLALDVATAIWKKLAPGCPMVGNTEQDVQDTEGYNPPYPTYAITWETPAALPILFAVTIQNSSQVPADAVTQIQNAIINAATGADGGPRARTGNLILATRFVAPIAALGAWAQVISILIGSNNVPGATFTGHIGGTTLTIDHLVSGTVAIGQTISDTSGAIVVGTKIISGSSVTWTVSNSQTVSGASFTGSAGSPSTHLVATAVTGTINIEDVVIGTGITTGTTILSQVSGTPGGAGTYNLSAANTASSASVTTGESISAATPALNSVQVAINQTPTFNAANIAVVLQS